MSNLRVAIIGAGPAGFYAAEHLLASNDLEVCVDMFDRLPTPWGLVRAGVAPDHPKIKSVSRQFEEIAEHKRYRFFGNIEFGRDVTRDELLSRYDAVLYSVGTRSERKLGILGEALPGSMAAADFVGWYNGHPDQAHLAPDLSGTHAVIVGNGNVALDVARILLLPHERLRKTDIADHALSALEKSNIRHVTILGRRGPAQAAFTTPELREITSIEDVDVEIDGAPLTPPEVLTGADLKRAQRNLSVIEKALTTTKGSEHKLCLKFLRSPLEIQGSSRVEKLISGINQITMDGDRIVATDTGERETLPADLIVRAVGYRGTALPDVPFDANAGVIPNERGVVIGGTREYVAGWIKRGPSGIIGTNRGDAVETADCLLGALANQAPLGASPDDIRDWLGEKCPDMVDQSEWARINGHEIQSGEATDRPRVKLVRVDDMLAVARGSLNTGGLEIGSAPSAPTAPRERATTDSTDT